jgi:hypothetical protein
LCLKDAILQVKKVILLALSILERVINLFLRPWQPHLLHQGFVCSISLLPPAPVYVISPHIPVSTFLKKLFVLLALIEILCVYFLLQLFSVRLTTATK